jgi:hypothetical protein
MKIDELRDIHCFDCGAPLDICICEPEYKHLENTETNTDKFKEEDIPF